MRILFYARQVVKAYGSTRFSLHLRRGNLPSTRGPMPEGEKKGRVGFTLVELLVVIAIIGLLAALLTPVVVNVRQKAGKVTCLNNLRQIGVGIGLYQSDHQGAFPAAWWKDGGRGCPARGSGLSQLSDYGLPFKAGTACSSVMLCANQPWWYCPACRKYADQKAWGQPDYGANPEVFANRADTKRRSAGP